MLVAGSEVKVTVYDSYIAPPNCEVVCVVKVVVYNTIPAYPHPIACWFVW